MFSDEFKKAAFCFYIRFLVVLLFLPTGLFLGVFLGMDDIGDKMENMWHSCPELYDEVFK